MLMGQIENVSTWTQKTESYNLRISFIPIEREVVKLIKTVKKIILIRISLKMAA